MKICVYGLWHLGCVTAACVAERFDTVAFDPSDPVIVRLRSGEPPISEPGLTELIRAGLAAGRLQFVQSGFQAIGDADVVWVTFDTPVDESDHADYGYVAARIRETFPHLRPGCIVLISSQVPVGFTARMEAEYRREYSASDVRFAYSPENLRLGKAIEAFRNPERIVIGVRDSCREREQLSELLSPFCGNLIWMSVESAEMTKHALNAFLATSVTFINEIAILCEAVGADAKQVEQGLKTEGRIGQRAYLGPGGAFAGGTLARDVLFLLSRAKEQSLVAPLLESIRTSNDLHKNWPRRKLEALLGGVGGKTVCVLGLTYKPGTDTLRRSLAVELCCWLAQRKATVRVFDPEVKSLPAEFAAAVQRSECARDALAGADAAVLATEWPVFREMRVEDFTRTMNRPLLLDPNRYLERSLGDLSKMQYVAVGTPKGLACS